MNLYVVGKIVGCFGIKGALKVQPMTHSAERLSKLHTVFVGTSQEETTSYDVEHVVLQQGHPLIKIVAVDDRTSAEPFVGKFLFVQEQDLQRPSEGSYFTDDIVGCDVWTVDGKHLGTVEDIYKYPAQDVWAVRNGTVLNMIPAVKEFIKSVDVRQRKIVVDVIEGLIQE